jgi:REP element-mobilizing transposase RayT
MLRGVERRIIFGDDEDRQDFVDRLARLIPEEGFACFAWALMPSHIHLVVRTGPVPLSRLMARLGTGYACQFNLRHGRVGHLFQNRFKSLLVELERHGRQLIRYVHLNPLRTGLVRSLEDLEDYPWTGHASLMGRRSCGFISAAEVLRWFDPDPVRGRSVLREWIAQELDEPSDSMSFAGGDLVASRPGCEGAIDGRMSEEVGRGAPGTLLKSGAWDLEKLLSWVCTRIGVDESEVRRGRRTRSASEARAITAYLATAELGLRGVDVAGALALGSGATSRAISRGRERMKSLGLSVSEWRGRPSS